MLFSSFPQTTPVLRAAFSIGLHFLVLESSIMGNTPSYITSGYEETLRYISRMIPLITFNFVEISDSLQFLEISYQILWRIPEKQTFVFLGWRSSIA